MKIIIFNLFLICMLKAAHLVENCANLTEHLFESWTLWSLWSLFFPCLHAGHFHLTASLVLLTFNFLVVSSCCQLCLTWSFSVSPPRQRNVFFPFGIEHCVALGPCFFPPPPCGSPSLGALVPFVALLNNISSLFLFAALFCWTSRWLQYCSCMQSWLCPKCSLRCDLECVVFCPYILAPWLRFSLYLLLCLFQ